MKRILRSSLVALAMLFSVNLHAYQSEYMYNGVRYNLDTETMTAIVVSNYNYDYYYNDYDGDIRIEPELFVAWDSVYTVTALNMYAFFNSEISSVSVPNSVISIGIYAFAECPFLHTVTLPDYISSIPTGAFREDVSLVSVGIPEGVTHIGHYAFMNCISLPVIEMPQSLNHLGDSAFADCKKLTSVVIPDSVISMGNGVFVGCEKLTYVTIPQRTISIGDYAFANCSRLLSITNNAIAPQTIDSSAFMGVDKSTCTLYVPKESVELYRNALVWKEFMNIEPINTKAIGNVGVEMQGSKVFRDGQILILRGDKTYTITGQEVK